jgi:hypothetical protein
VAVLYVVMLRGAVLSVLCDWPVCIEVQLLGTFSELIVGTDSVLHWLYLLTSVEHTALRSSPLENL